MKALQITAEDLAAICGVKLTDNLRSVHSGLVMVQQSWAFGSASSLAIYLAQISHESNGFQYDREIWGPTPAQKRYDTRTDLGNTPQADGDGYKFRGRTAIQITGHTNTKAFYHWCCQTFPHLEVPDFVANPDLMNTDPWEGLGPIWYWMTRGCEKLAMSGDFDAVTRRINGGLNGAADRRLRFARIANHLLGYAGGPANFTTAQKIKISGNISDGMIHTLLDQLDDLPVIKFLDPNAPVTTQNPLAQLLSWILGLLKRGTTK